MLNPTNDFNIRKISDATATGTTLVTSGIVDMAGWDSVLFLTTVGSFNAGNFVKAQEGAASNMSDSADLAGSKVTPTANTTAVFVAVERPPKRYLTISVTRAGATTTVGDIWAIQYNGHAPLPATNSSSALLGKLLADPIEGTA